MSWSFQATGDETEIFRLDNDNATPLVIVPFLNDETFEDHQARVFLVVRAEAIANADRYEAAMNELELPANGDDFNAIMEMLRGAPYRPPHTEGR